MPSRFLVRQVACALPLLLAVGAVHAAAPRPMLPSPISTRGAIGITVRGKLPVGFIRSAAVQVHFVQLEEGVDPLAGDFVVPSNWVRDKQIFLLNAKPGRYVAVAAILPGAPGWESKAFFSQEMIPLTEVTVGPGEVIFAGAFTVQMDLSLDKADPAQAHYIEMIAGGDAAKGQLRRSLSGRGLYRASLESAAQSAADEREFWEEAKGNSFRGQKKWLDLVARRLAAIGEPAP